MSKLFITFVAFTLSFTILFFAVPKETLAESCANAGITYVPKSFKEDPGAITLNFTITQNVLRRFETARAGGAKVWVHCGGKDPGPWTITSNQLTVHSLQFPLTLNRDTRVERAEPHRCSLHWDGDPSEPNGRQLCSDIDYRVGIGNRCELKPNATTIQPGETLAALDVIGPAGRTFTINVNARNSGLTVTTDSHGDGRATNIPIPSQSGDTVPITLQSQTIRCSTSIHLSLNANPQPTPPPPGTTIPVIGVPPAGSQTSAAGEKCDSATGQRLLPADPGYDSADGISTAIGCIPTQPTALVGAVLKFIAGISGGIAFLLMLMGAFQMITSSGNPESLNAGRERFTSAIIGLLFVIFAVLLLQIIGVDILKIPGFNRV